MVALGGCMVQSDRREESSSIMMCQAEEFKSWGGVRARELIKRCPIRTVSRTIAALFVNKVNDNNVIY